MTSGNASHLNAILLRRRTVTAKLQPVAGILADEGEAMVKVNQWLLATVISARALIRGQCRRAKQGRAGSSSRLARK
jgi:hypothetical protein